MSLFDVLIIILHGDRKSLCDFPRAAVGKLMLVFVLNCQWEQLIGCPRIARDELRCPFGASSTWNENKLIDPTR